MVAEFFIEPNDGYVQITALGGELTLDFDFPLYKKADLKILETDLDSIVATLTYGAEYTIDDDQLYNPLGGMVELNPIQYPLGAIAGHKFTLLLNPPEERVTDFQPAGDFYARDVNQQLDNIVQILQAHRRDINRCISFSEDILSAGLTFATPIGNHVLAYNPDGTVVIPGPSMDEIANAQEYAQLALDAAQSVENFTSYYNVKLSGATGDGFTDDYAAFIHALSVADSIFVPPGEYRLTGQLPLGSRKTLIGAGAKTILRFKEEAFTFGSLPSTWNTVFDGIVIYGRYVTVKDLHIVGASVGLKLKGDATSCVQNHISNVTIWDCDIGIMLDGGDDFNFPCYWNELHNILVIHPHNVGVWLTSGTGDTPNANKLRHVRVYSSSQSMIGYKTGIWVEKGNYTNSFVDCEANMHTGASYILRFGPNAHNNHFVNYVSESHGSASGIWFDAGAGTAGINTIQNYEHATAGSAIRDSDGLKNFNLINAGFPTKNTFGQTLIKKLFVNNLLPANEFIAPSPAADQTMNTATTVHLLSSFAGTWNYYLPNPDDAPGELHFIKRIDNSDNPIAVKTVDDPDNGPDGINLRLVKTNDYAIVYCNGAKWFLFASNSSRERNTFFSGGGTIYADQDIQTHFISSSSGAAYVNLPDKDDDTVTGKKITFKKTDLSTNLIEIFDPSGDPIEGLSSLYLTNQYDYYTLITNGASWFIVDTNVRRQRTNFFSGGSGYTVNPNIDWHIVSGFSGVVSAQVPAANDVRCVNREVTIKKSDSSSNAVVVGVAGGGNIEGSSTISLTAMGHVIVLFSNGSQWYIKSLRN